MRFLWSFRREAPPRKDNKVVFANSRALPHNSGLYQLSFLAAQGNVDAQIKLGVMFQWGDLPPIVVPLATRVLEPCGHAPISGPGPMRLFRPAGPQGPGTMMRTRWDSYFPGRYGDGVHYSLFSTLRSSPGHLPERGTMRHSNIPDEGGC